MVPFLTLVVISLSHRLKGIPLYRSQQIEFVPDLVAFLLLSECRSCNKIKLSNMGTSLLYEGSDYASDSTAIMDESKDTYLYVFSLSATAFLAALTSSLLPEFLPRPLIVSQ